MDTQHLSCHAVPPPCRPRAFRCWPTSLWNTHENVENVEGVVVPDAPDTIISRPSRQVVDQGWPSSQEMSSRCNLVNARLAYGIFNETHFSRNHSRAAKKKSNQDTSSSSDLEIDLLREYKFASPSERAIVWRFALAINRFGQRRIESLLASRAHVLSISTSRQ